MASSDGVSHGYAALGLDVAAVAVAATVFVPDLYQEVATINLVMFVVLLMLILAFVLAVVSIRERRVAGQRAGVGVIALGISVLPLVLALFWVIGAVACLGGAQCGTG